MSYSIYNIKNGPSDAIPPISKIEKKQRIKDKGKEENFQDILDIALNRKELKEKVAMLKISERDDENLDPVGGDIEDFEVIEDLDSDYSEEEEEEEDDSQPSSGKRQKGYTFNEAFERRDPIMPEIDDMALFAYIPEDAIVLGYDIESFVDSLDEDDSLSEIREKAKNSLGLGPIDDMTKRRIIDGIDIMYGDEKKSEKQKSIKQVDSLNELEAASILEYLKDKTGIIQREGQKERQRSLTQEENLLDTEEDVNE